MMKIVKVPINSKQKELGKENELFAFDNIIKSVQWFDKPTLKYSLYISTDVQRNITINYLSKEFK